MSEPFLGEIRLMAFGYAPDSWVKCDGALLPINQNQALFALLGTTYGGNGVTTFALPDLRDRLPIHRGAGHALGERGGVAAVTLTAAEIPSHVHTASATNADVAGTRTRNPANAVLGPANNLYAAATATPTTTLHPSTLAPAGGGQPHPNEMPYLTLNYCIAVQGIFPSPG